MSLFPSINIFTCNPFQASHRVMRCQRDLWVRFRGWETYSVCKSRPTTAQDCGISPSTPQQHLLSKSQVSSSQNVVQRNMMEHSDNLHVTSYCVCLCVCFCAGQSSINFLINFVEAFGGAHGDFSLKQSRPSVGMFKALQ